MTLRSTIEYTRAPYKTIPILMWAPKIWKVGVTGGIGAGKSNIAKILSAQGASVLDADKLGHRTYEPGSETFKSLINVFGSTIVDESGQINRRALGSLGEHNCIH